MATITKKLTIELDVTGDYKDFDLIEHLEYLLGGGSCKISNPFIHEDGNAEIQLLNVELEN